MRVMAVDYGDARTGIAVSDAFGLIAGEAFTINEWNAERLSEDDKEYFYEGRFTINEWNAERLSEEIAEAARRTGAEKIVLGYPRNMDGSAGARAEKSAAFSEILREKTGLEVILWDERRTTADAHRILSEAGRRGKKRKEKIDAVAATLILEGYLNSLK